MEVGVAEWRELYNIGVMARRDKYGRGSAAVNGEGFVDFAPDDTFAALEAQLKQRIADRFDNPVLGISASIGSKRNASELAKHLASGEEEEVHKFAAKNVGVLFARGGVGVVHFDKKAVDETREKPKDPSRVFTFCLCWRAAGGDDYD